jgi:hypothetical protein
LIKEEVDLRTSIEPDRPAVSLLGQLASDNAGIAYQPLVTAEERTDAGPHSESPLKS